MPDDGPDKHLPVAAVQLNHPTQLPNYEKVRYHGQHPTEGPAITIFSGGSGARVLSERLIDYTHNSAHILSVFDDGGSSRILRERLGMPPPGDFRSRLMSLSDMSRHGNPEVSGLFRTRLPKEGTPDQLANELGGYLRDDHPMLASIEPRYRRIIVRHLTRFARRKPDDFDLRGGSIGNFVIAGAYLSMGDLESVIFEFAALAAARGQVIPVCKELACHLRAEYADGRQIVGQSEITSRNHAPIQRLSVVVAAGDGWNEVQPELNPLARAAIQDGALIAFAMGSFFTSIVSTLLVRGIGQVLRQARCPKVFVANLREDRETPGMSVSQMLRELHRYAAASDPDPGPLNHYVHYAIVNDHGNTRRDGFVPVDLDEIRALGIEPIVLPLAVPEGNHLVNDAEILAAVLLSLC